MSELLAPLVPLLLFLHLLGVLAGIGPTFAFASITEAGRRDPAHAAFATAVVRTIQERLTVPLALVTFGSGVGLLVALGYDLGRTPWLLVSILLFLSSFGWAVLVQNRDLLRLLRAAADPVGRTPAELAALARARRRLRWGGRYMRIAAITILLLMITKPG